MSSAPQIEECDWADVRYEERVWLDVDGVMLPGRKVMNDIFEPCDRCESCKRMLGPDKVWREVGA